MISKKKIFMLIMAGTLLAAVSCSGSKDDGDKKTEEDNYYSGSLSDADMEGDHIKLELCKNVTVDADITPVSKYKDGLKIYYTKRVRVNDVADLKKYKKNPSIFGKPLNEFLAIAEENSAGKFDMENTIFDRSFVCVPYVNADETFGSLSCFFEFDKNKKPLSENVKFLAHLTDEETEGHTTDGITKINFGENLLSSTMGKGMPDLSFGTKAEIGEKLSEVIAGLTDTDIYRDYYCVAMNEDFYSSVINNTYGTYGDIEVKPLKSEYYVYFFPYTIDGIEWKGGNISYLLMTDIALQIDDREKLSEDVGCFETGILPLNANPLAIAYDDAGIQEMDLSNEMEVSGVYKEIREIIPLDGVLSLLKDKFSGKAPLDTEIKSIQLCYTGAFSDVQDGEIQNIAKPYWYVDYSRRVSDRIEDCFAVVDVESGKVYD